MMSAWIVCTEYPLAIRIVTDDRGVIVEAAPVAKRFIGQPLPNLHRWVERTFGEFIAEVTFE